MNRTILILAALLAAAIPKAAAVEAAPYGQSDIFSIQGRPAKSALVLAPWNQSPPDHPPESPMLQEIAGIAASLNANQIRNLNRSAATETRIAEDTTIIEPLWSIQLTNRIGSQTVQIGRVQQGWIIAESTSGRVRLETEAFNRIAKSWITPRPDPAEAPQNPNQQPEPIQQPAISESFTVTPTPIASPIRLDSASLSERFARGRAHSFTAPLTRTIDEETFTLRIPAGHKNNRPVGLLVWINPTPTGDPPQQILLAADTHNLAIVTPANAGNHRPVVDRLQLALDAVQTARSAVWIDRNRIYIAGMSGGGRLSSMLWAAAPDVFTAAICVVGINSHHNIPTGDSKGTVWPASHRLPRGELAASLRPHPIAAISGPKDFNFIESRARIRALSREGFHARLFDLPDLGHAMPTQQQFLAALRWIELSYTEKNDRAAQSAAGLLSRLDPETLADPAKQLTIRERRALERITLIAPWTEPAWTAAARLGY